jgi:hypothetical protein
MSAESPILYVLYSMDIIDKLRRLEGIRIGLPGMTRSINSLGYADDLTVLATSKIGMEQALEVIRQWTLENGLNMNVEKSTVLVFKGEQWEVEVDQEGQECEGRPGCRCHFRMGDGFLARVKKHKYLGIVHQEDGKWEAAREDRLRFGGQQAAMVRLMGMDLDLKPDIVTSLVESLVITSLLYGAGLWNLIQ